MLAEEYAHDKLTSDRVDTDMGESIEVPPACLLPFMKHIALLAAFCEWLHLANVSVLAKPRH